MSAKGPLALVNESFGGKDKLVEKLVGLIGSSAEESKDDLRKRLLGVANKKLLRLQKAAAIVKEKYGSRDKLVADTATAMGRPGDAKLTARLDGYSAPRLVAIAGAAAKRQALGAGAKVAAAQAPTEVEVARSARSPSSG
jgi:hypothetical protein